MSAFQADRRRFDPGRPLRELVLEPEQPNRALGRVLFPLRVGLAAFTAVRELSFVCPPRQKRAHLAQSVEHVLGKDEVVGSIPMVGSGEM